MNRISQKLTAVTFCGYISSLTARRTCSTSQGSNSGNAQDLDPTAAANFLFDDMFMEEKITPPSTSYTINNNANNTDLDQKSNASHLTIKVKTLSVSDNNERAKDINPLARLPRFLAADFDSNDRSNRLLLSGLAAAAEADSRNYHPSANIGYLAPTSPVPVAWHCATCHTGKWKAKVIDRYQSAKDFEEIFANYLPLLSLSNSTIDDPTIVTPILTTHQMSVLLAGRKSHCPICSDKILKSLNSTSEGSSEKPIKNSTVAANATASSKTLVNLFPLVASSWSQKLNNIVTERNPTVVNLSHVDAESTRRFWWDCSTCRRSWNESPFSRTQTRNGNLNCPRCHSREDIIAETMRPYSDSSCGSFVGKTLSSKPYLVCEIDKTTQQKPVLDMDPSVAADILSDMMTMTTPTSFDMLSADNEGTKQEVDSTLLDLAADREASVAMWRAVPIDSQQVAPWHCSYCNGRYTMPVRERALMGKDCPSCTGTTGLHKGTSAGLNPALLLTHLRPDVAREIVDTSHYTIEKLSVLDSRTFSFVCRVCLTNYRQRLRDRCLPHGGCPTCGGDPQKHRITKQEYNVRLEHVRARQKPALKDRRLIN